MSTEPTTALTFSQLRKANVHRLPTFKNCHGEPAHSEPDGSDWIPAQWLQAIVGELGEYANKRKKFEIGDIDLEEFNEHAAKELADVQIYLDILAFRLGIDLGAATVAKFNEVSARVGSHVFIRFPSPPAPSSVTLEQVLVSPTMLDRVFAPLRRIASGWRVTANCLCDSDGEGPSRKSLHSCAMQLEDACKALEEDAKKELAALFSQPSPPPAPPACPFAKSDMTPCVQQDGDMARADDGVCVGCGRSAPAAEPSPPPASAEEGEGLQFYPLRTDMHPSTVETEKQLRIANTLFPKVEAENARLTASLAAAERERDGLRENNAQLRTARDGLQGRADECESSLATATDCMNTWAREWRVAEVRDPYRGMHLRELADRLWVRAMEKINLPTLKAERLESDLAAAERELAEAQRKAEAWDALREDVREYQRRSNFTLAEIAYGRVISKMDSLLAAPAEKEKTDA